MVNIRTWEPPIERWTAEQLAEHLGITEKEADKIMTDCSKEKNIGMYDLIEKDILLDYINEKQRIEREREQRYQADLATVRQTSVLEEQVKTLKEQIKVLRESSAASTKTANEAQLHSTIANLIALASLVIAILALVLG